MKTKLKTKYNTDKSDLEKKIRDAEKETPDINVLVKKTDYNSKITEIEGKISSISGLATNSALTAVENKIPDIGNLVKKTDYSTKINEIEKKATDYDHDKYITTSEFNKLTAENFDARLAQENLVTKADFEAKLTSLNKKINSNKTKHLLFQNEFKKLQAFDSSYFRGKSYFEEDSTQNYLVFQLMYKYFKKIGNTELISEWKSKRFSNEIIKPPSTSFNSFASTVEYTGKIM